MDNVIELFEDFYRAASIPAVVAIIVYAGMMRKVKLSSALVFIILSFLCMFCARGALFISGILPAMSKRYMMPVALIVWIGAGYALDCILSSTSESKSKTLRVLIAVVFGVMALYGMVSHRKTDLMHDAAATIKSSEYAGPYSIITDMKSYQTLAYYTGGKSFRTTPSFTRAQLRKKIRLLSMRSTVFVYLRNQDTGLSAEVRRKPRFFGLTFLKEICSKRKAYRLYVAPKKQLNKK